MSYWRDSWATLIGGGQSHRRRLCQRNSRHLSTVVIVSGIGESFRPLHPSRCRCGATDFTCACSQINAIETLEGWQQRMPRARAVAKGVRSKRQPRQTQGGQGSLGLCLVTAWMRGGSGARSGRPRQGCPSSAPVRGADTQRGSGEVAIDTDFCDNADRLAAPRARPAMSLPAATAVGSTETGCRETLQLPALCPEAFGQGSAKCLFCLLFTRTGTPIAYGVRHRWTCRPALCSLEPREEVT